MVLWEDKPNQEWYDHHDKENDGHIHNPSWSIWWKRGCIKRERQGYCKICWMDVREIQTTHKLIPIIDLVEKPRVDGKKRGISRKEDQPKCECTHYYYEHEKGSCTKCECVK